ncbi:MAG: potassium/proton antiporter [Clostridia bacterium]|nr:potassium/proton antiporter [Clostridia bacterium]
MPIYILVISVIIFLCVLLNKISHKLGMPMLLAFILLGMLFGTDGILGIPFDNYRLSEQVCSVALIFIMFYGGFGTSWNEARPVALKAGLLSTLGVVLTAVLTGAFCHFALGIGFWESFLIGSVISSTDAASVFSILRSKKLGLKENTASLLEMESGSNDPCSYMLTAIVLSIMSGSASGGALAYLVFAQLTYGVLFGAAIAALAVFFLRRFTFASAGFDMAFVLGVALLSYALPATVNGNGYLSAYIVGIVLGNVRLKNKRSIVHFFDGLTSLMQVLIFFLLGLLATPSRILPILLPAAAIMLFLTFVGRPAVIFAILSPMRCSLPQKLLVSFAGLRGAASVVFAIMATVHEASTRSDVYHIVFCIVLLSIAIQGSLLAPVARKLGMCDKSIDVLKTFSDYEDTDLHFTQTQLTEDHPWVGKTVRDLALPPDLLIAMLLRGGERIVPSGKSELCAGDTAVLSSPAFEETGGAALRERTIHAGSSWIGKTISEYSPDAGELVVLILRRETVVIPKGGTQIQADDVLVICT